MKIEERSQQLVMHNIHFLSIILYFPSIYSVDYLFIGLKRNYHILIPESNEEKYM